MKKLNDEELKIVQQFKNCLKEGLSLKSTTPVKKCIEGRPRYTMWAQKNGSKERFLVYCKNDGELKYLTEEYVNKLRENHCLTTIKK